METICRLVCIIRICQRSSIDSNNSLIILPHTFCVTGMPLHENKFRKQIHTTRKQIPAANFQQSNQLLTFEAKHLLTYPFKRPRKI